MKKLIYGSLFLATVGIGLIGCQKEKSPAVENSSKYNGVSTDGRFLIFSNVSDYEAIVNASAVEVRENFSQHLSSLSYKNYFSGTTKASTTSQKSQNVQEMDEFFGTLLNEDGVIQIENFLYKIDLIKAQVFVIDANDKENDYLDLINGNSSNKKVKVYSVNDNVLHDINGDDSEKCTGTDGFEVYTQDGLGSSYAIEASVKIFNAGIYHRVTGRAKKIGTYNGSYTLKVEAGLNNIQIKRKPCSNNEVTFHAMGIKAQASNNPEVIFEAYSKSWSVKNMYMYVRTRAEFYDATATLYRNTGYTGANF